MKKSNSLTILSLLSALFVAVYAGIGLFSTGGHGPFEFTTLHGQTVEIYGQGIYQTDASFRAPIFRGTDAVVLFLCVPVLLIAQAPLGGAPCPRVAPQTVHHRHGRGVAVRAMSLGSWLGDPSSCNSSP